MMGLKGRRVALLALALMLLTGCAQGSGQEARLTVIATLFPQYDFVRQIAGDRAQVRMLLPAGAESHSYEPTPRDMMDIQRAGLFVYTGDEMEPWAARILEGLDTGALPVVNASQGIELYEEEDGHDGHQHAVDPHIWMDPTLAQKMVDNILEGLIAADPEGEAVYRENARAYSEQLAALDQAFSQAVSEGARKEMIFGGRFAYGYFIRRYGLSYQCAYDACSSESEPSVKTMAGLISEIKEQHIPVVYHEELVDPKVARSIAEETGAQLLVFNTCHNVSQEQLDAGVTYLDLMNENLTNLKEGLN